MTSLSSGTVDPRSIAFRLQIDDICSEFETAFGRETTSRIEPFVARSDGAERPHVLAELIRTERECRQTLGDDPSVSEYLARFPGDTPTVRAVFAGAVLKPGSRVGKYVVAEKLGVGGMGVVYLAADELVGRRVALKMLSPRLTASAKARERLLAEARSVGRLSHPNVVTLYEAGDEQGGCYLVMEHMAGGSAADRLKACGRLEWREAVAVAADVCRGLSAAHAAGLVHLDVKPANILLADRPGAGPVAKVSDFGLARGAGEDAGERVAGTPRYMAPEQTAGGPTDGRTDVYGVGATLYALLTGAPPRGSGAGPATPAPDPRDTAPDVPAGVARVVRRALRPAPGDRYQSIDELLGALDRAQAEGGTGVRFRSGVAVALLLGCGLAAWQLVTPAPEAHTSAAPDPATVAPAAPESEPVHAPDPVAEVGPWEQLFDGKTLAGWETRPAPEYGQLERLQLRGKSPHTFTVVTVDGGPAIRGYPDGDWRLTTLRDFEDYQLRLEYRWGGKRAGERSNSGVMYHYQSATLDNSFAKIRFHELDLWPPEVGNLLGASGVSLKRDMDTQPNFERPAPAWNRVDLMCVGDRAVQAINGRLTASYRDARINLGGESDPAYTSGAVQLQTLTGEVFFRDIKVRRIRALSSRLYEQE